VTGGSVPPYSIGTSLPSKNLNEKHSNKKDWYQEMMDNVQNNNAQPSIPQDDFIPIIPIAQNIGQG